MMVPENYYILKPEDHTILDESDFGMPGLRTIESISQDHQIQAPAEAHRSLVLQAEGPDRVLRVVYGLWHGFGQNGPSYRSRMRA